MSRAFFRLSCAAGLAALLASSLPAHAHAPLATIPIGRCDLPKWCARHTAKLVEGRSLDPQIVFLGDSITYNWERNGPEPWAHYRPAFDHLFGQWRPFDLGFIGDTTASVLWRIDHGELDHIHPRVIVLLIGTNNFGRVHWSAEDTEAGIATILSRIAQHQPQAHVLLLGVPPSDRGPWVADMMARTNSVLGTRYAHDPRVHYLNINDLLEHDGQIDRDAYYDPKLTPPEHALHPIATKQEEIGTRILAAIRPWLAAQ